MYGCFFIDFITYFFKIKYIIMYLIILILQLFSILSVYVYKYCNVIFIIILFIRDARIAH